MTTVSTFDLGQVFEVAARTAFQFCAEHGVEFRDSGPVISHDLKGAEQLRHLCDCAKQLQDYPTAELAEVTEEAEKETR